REHLRLHPVEDAEMEKSRRGRSGHEADPLRAYGTTALLAVVGDDGALVAQLGDGDILVVTEDGRVEAPIAHDPDLVANETTSLCLPDAGRFLRWAALDLRADPLALLVLATDGYGNSFEDATWRVDVGRGIARYHA